MPAQWAYSKPFFEPRAEREGIPVIRDYAVEDLVQLPVEAWKRKGGKGALIILHGGRGWTAAYVCEIASGEALIPQRHLKDEGFGLGTDLPLWRVNLIPDAKAAALSRTLMGTGMGLLQLNLASNTMSAHMAEQKARDSLPGCSAT